MRDEDIGFRRLTASKNRDLSPIEFREQERMVYYLWLRNAMAGRIIEILTDFIVGDGISYQVSNPKVKEIIDEFWNDPINDLDMFQYDLVQELFLYGEFVIPVQVLKPVGKVKMGYIDPANIVKVEKYAWNPRFVDKIYVNVVNPETNTPEEKVLEVIKRDRNPFSATYGKLVGNCFLFQINKVSNATRGISEIFRLADWIYGLDQLLFTSMERIYYLMNFIWDISVRDVVDEKEIEDVRERVQNEPMTPGSVHIHSDREEWRAIAPDLKTEQISQHIELIRNFILGGAGIPEHWYGGGEGVTYATSKEMNAPVIRRLRRKQKYVKRIFEKLLNYVVQQAVDYGRLEKGVDYEDEEELKVNVIMSEIISKDISGMLKNMNATVQTLAMAQNQNWITEEQAKAIFEMMMKRNLDIEIPKITEQGESKRIDDKKLLEIYEDVKKKAKQGIDVY